MTDLCWADSAEWKRPARSDGPIWSKPPRWRIPSSPYAAVFQRYIRNSCFRNPRRFRLLSFNADHVQLRQRGACCASVSRGGGPLAYLCSISVVGASSSRFPSSFLFTCNVHFENGNVVSLIWFWTVAYAITEWLVRECSGRRRAKRGRFGMTLRVCVSASPSLDGMDR